MNTLAICVLIFFVIVWIVYLFGVRNRLVAFTLWFPVTATSLLGTILWLWFGLGLLTAPAAGDAAYGFAAMGAGIVFGAFLPFPVILAISIWQRPQAGSYGLSQVLPIILIYFGLVAVYRPLSEASENRPLRLTVLDTEKKPIAFAKVAYETFPKASGVWSFPSFALKGNVETGSDGTVVLPVPKTHDIFCDVSMSGYANLNVEMDRTWGSWNWHQTSISWQFPPKSPLSGQGGQVSTDVDDTNPMRLTVYLPKVNANIPSYGPVRIVNESTPGKITWTPQPSEIHYH
jgi:hypothetical protein